MSDDGIRVRIWAAVDENEWSIGPPYEILQNGHVRHNGQPVKESLTLSPVVRVAIYNRKVSSYPEVILDSIQHIGKFGDNNGSWVYLETGAATSA